MKIQFIKYSKVYFIFTGVLLLASLFSLFYFGLKPGIDLVGGSLLEVVYDEVRPTNQEVKEVLADLSLEDLLVQSIAEKGLLLRMKEVDEEIHQEILLKLTQLGQVKELRFESIGPVIGQELRQKTSIMITLSLLAILFYIALAFRKLNYPLKAWQYGLASLLALVHDTLIPLAFFSFLGNQVTIPVIVALLTVIGYSINDTVVVFDRIRENLLRISNQDYEEVVNLSLNQSVSRSINTSLTTLLALGAIFFFGGETLKDFSLALIIGVIAGTYSSLCLVTPSLVAWLKWKKRLTDKRKNV